VTGALACVCDVAWLPGLSTRRPADLRPGTGKTDARDAYVIADAPRSSKRLPGLLASIHPALETHPGTGPAAPGSSGTAVDLRLPGPGRHRADRAGHAPSSLADAQCSARTLSRQITATLAEALAVLLKCRVVREIRIAALLEAHVREPPSPPPSSAGRGCYVVQRPATPGVGMRCSFPTGTAMGPATLPAGRARRSPPCCSPVTAGQLSSAQLRAERLPGARWGAPAVPLHRR
jgi:hypothetical protein